MNKTINLIADSLQNDFVCQWIDSYLLQQVGPEIKNLLNPS